MSKLIDVHAARALEGKYWGKNSPSTSTWTDLAGNYNGTLSATFDYDDVDSGWDGANTSGDPCCLLFKAADSDKVTFGHSTALNTNVFSFSLWLNITSYPTTYLRVLGKQGYNTGGWALLVNEGENGKINFITDNNGTAHNLYSDNTPNTAEWINIIGTFAGNGVSNNKYLYINNSVQATVGNQLSMTTPDGNEPLVMGGTSWAGARYFNGKINQMQFFNHVLTSDERSAIYNTGRVYVDTLALGHNAANTSVCDFQENNPSLLFNYAATSNGGLVVERDNTLLLGHNASAEDSVLILNVDNKLSGFANIGVMYNEKGHLVMGDYDEYGKRIFKFMVEGN